MLNFFVVDSKPIRICQNIRISKCKLVKNNLSKEKVLTKKNRWRKKVDEDFRGYCASKKEYYYGLKLTTLNNSFGLYREFSIDFGSISDIKAFASLRFDLPLNSTILADKAYNDSNLELHFESQNIILDPIRKANSKSQNAKNYHYNLFKSSFRKPIETTFSFIPPKFHATNLQGFVNKVKLFLLSHNFNQLFKILSKQLF